MVENTEEAWLEMLLTRNLPPTKSFHFYNMNGDVLEEKIEMHPFVMLLKPRECTVSFTSEELCSVEVYKLENRLPDKHTGKTFELHFRLDEPNFVALIKVTYPDGLEMSLWISREVDEGRLSLWKSVDN